MTNMNSDILSVLAVFAHPDDEVMVAGTLARLQSSDMDIHCLYLTHGEDGPTGDIVERPMLGKEREKELINVAKILKVATVEVLDYPDRHLNTIDPDVIKDVIRKRIEQYQPTMVICFDDTIGLYGHPDHAFSGKCTQELLKTESLGVSMLMIMTLPKHMIALAKMVSKTFKERYTNSASLPPARLGINITPFAKQKNAVVLAHKTQWQVMKDVQPLYDKIPYQIYYRIFAKEYFDVLRLE